MKSTCDGPECDRPVHARGLCKAHYGQLKRTGTIKPLRKTKSGCSHEGCDRPHSCKGFCSTHYRQFKTHGATFDVGDLYHWPKSGHASDEDYFWSKVNRTDDCWLWTGAIDNGGYGAMVRGRDAPRRAAHRFSYELHVGPIPDGLQIDHTCHRRNCVNPDHLRPVTASQNSQNLKGARSDNMTGFRGVSKNGKRFGATVGVNRRRLYLGTFDTAEEAAEVARLARLKYHTHNYLDRQSD